MGVRLSEAEHPVAVLADTSEPSPGPVRTCVGCRRRSARSVLLRVVAVEVDGVWSVVPDPGHKLAGRGASLHPDPACFGLAERRRAFVRALRRAGPLSLDPLRDHLAAVAGPSAPDQT